MTNRKPALASSFGKIPPQDPELEEAVLGAALLESESLETLFEVIHSPDVFYVDANQKIFKAMQYLYDTGSPVDILTMTDYFRKKDELESVGGPYYLTRLTMAVLSSAHIESHARLIMEKYLKREQIRVGGIMIKNGYDDGVDVFTAMETAEVALYEVSTIGVKKKVSHISSGVRKVLKAIDDLRSSNKEFSGVATGFPTLNDITGGLQPGDLIIIAARPSVGKTAFTISMSLNIADDLLNGGPVALFNLEMAEDQVIQRQLANSSGVLMDHIKKAKKMDAAEFKRVTDAASKLSVKKIFIDDTAGLTLSELRTKARRLVKKEGVVAIILDYLQLMESDNDRQGNREQEVSKISRGLKKLAKELKVPIIALSQMTRGIDTQNRPPQLSDLRESGAIEQDADLVMFLYRPGKEVTDIKQNLKGKILGSIKKHRNGACDDDIIFDANNKIQRWTEYNPHDPQVVNSQQFQQIKSEADNKFSFNPSPIVGEPIDDLPF